MTTKTVILGISLLLFNNAVVTAQNDTVKIKREYVAYTFFYNVVPDQFNYPLIGFVNVARGSYKGVHIGFINTTLKDFKGLKTGFVNTTIGNSLGVLAGFVNTASKDYSGVQLGFVNTTLKNTEGFQSGFVNIAGKGIKGSQLGFLNITDTISNGVPIGFLSIVKKGGYMAVEVSVDELYPFNVAFKIGVPWFYTFVQSSYYYNYGKPFAFGLGFGSLIPLGKNFYFNPEAGSMYSFNNESNTAKLATNVRYSINSKLQLAAGLSAVWLNYPQGENMYDHPFFSLINHEINVRNSILVGARIALSFNFTDL
jgi:hypothetical protein